MLVRISINNNNFSPALIFVSISSEFKKCVSLPFYKLMKRLQTDSSHEDFPAKY